MANQVIPRYPFFPHSAHAHKWLDPLAENGKGLEIGKSAHNDFFIKNCINVDYTDLMDTIFKQEEIRLCGQAAPVDVVAFADDLPFEDDEFDFLLNSHLFEHQCNPIKCLMEWHRIIRDSGILYSVIPLRDAIEADRHLPLTTVSHQFEDYDNGATFDTHPLEEGHGKYGHYHRYTLNSYLEFIEDFNNLILVYIDKLEVVDTLPIDDKVGNGFVVVHRIMK